MTDDAMLVLSGLFGIFWKLFNSWYIPGTNVTPAEFILFVLSIGIFLRFLGDISFGLLRAYRDAPGPGISRIGGNGRNGSIRIPFRRG